MASAICVNIQLSSKMFALCHVLSTRHVNLAFKAIIFQTFDIQVHKCDKLNRKILYCKLAKRLQNIKFSHLPLLLSGVEAEAAGMYLDNLTFGRSKWPPTSGMTSTEMVCFLHALMSMTEAARPQTAQTAWSAKTCKTEIKNYFNILMFANNVINNGFFVFIGVSDIMQVSGTFLDAKINTIKIFLYFIHINTKWIVSQTVSIQKVKNSEKRSSFQ